MPLKALLKPLKRLFKGLAFHFSQVVRNQITHVLSTSAKSYRTKSAQALAHALYYVVQCKWYIMVLYHRQTKAALCVRETGRTARLGLSSMHCCVCPLTGSCPLTGNCPLTSMQAFLRAQMTACSLLLRGSAALG